MRGGQGDRQPDAAGAYPERADQADEAARLRRGLRLRPRRRGRRSPARTTSPTAWRASEFYRPSDRGFEREIGKRLDYWARLRAEAEPNERRRSGPSAEDEAEIRLDRWFRRHFPQLTQGAMQKLCRTGQVRVDGKRAEAATRLAPGQAVRVPPLPAGDRRPVDRRGRPARRGASSSAWCSIATTQVIVLNKPHGPAGAGRPRHHPPSRRHAGRAARRPATGRGWCTGSTATPPACWCSRARRAWRPSSRRCSAGAT